MTGADGEFEWQAEASRWRSLRYYSLYRLIIACGLAFVGRMVVDDPSRLVAWSAIVAIYVVAAVTLLYFQRLARLPFTSVLALHVVVDLLALGALMFASGGHRGGMPYMIMVVVAAGGLLGEGRLVFFHAAVASIVAMLVQGLRLLRTDGESGELAAVGLLCIGFFAVATVARLLAMRALKNERLAYQRGAALQSQVRVNERVIADLHDGVLVLRHDGAIRHLNPKAITLLGFAPAHGTPLTGAAPELAAALASGAGSVRLEGSGAAVRLRVLDGGEGEDRIVYLEDMERLQRESQQIKLAALGRLTGGIAHEIRNPLAAISHASELLGEEKRAEVQARLLRIVQENCKRINRMVSDVLELGRRDRTTPEQIPLADFVASAVSEMERFEGMPAGRVGIEVPDTLTVRFDRVHLQQIVWNLVWNAVRHGSGQPGAVRVRAHAAGPGTVVMDICDDGPGVPPEMRSRLFEPFFTTASKGTGLGLYIARELADANGGELEYVEAPRGADFRLTAEGQA